MSTHNLDVSGARALTTRTNDPASTYASTPAKAGDDVAVTISGSGELRIVLPTTARLQRRSYPQKTLVRDANGAPTKDDAGGFVYEDADPEEQLILVLPGGIGMAFFRCSGELLPEGEKPSYEGTPHTNVSARRWKEPHFTESGTLLEEVELSPAHEAWSDSIPRIMAGIGVATEDAES